MDTFLMVVFALAYVLSSLRAFNDRVSGGSGFATAIVNFTSFAGMIWVAYIGRLG